MDKSTKKLSNPLAFPSFSLTCPSILKRITMKHIKFLGMLFCLCLLSCGGKAQETEEKKTGELPQPGAYGFPKEMDVKCDVVLKITYTHSADELIWTRSSVSRWAPGWSEYALYYYEDGQWKDITEETIAPELLEAYRNANVDVPLFAGVDYEIEIPLYSHSASSIRKGLYKILFAINYKPCYVIFEL